MAAGLSEQKGRASVLKITRPPIEPSSTAASQSGIRARSRRRQDDADQCLPERLGRVTGAALPKKSGNDLHHAAQVVPLNPVAHEQG
jgi:hypothetical protein